MVKKLWWGCLLALVTPGIACAGWIIEWENTPVRADERQSSTRSTAYIEDNRTRIEQDHVTTVFDYNTGTFTLLNPTSKYYWSAPIDDYVKNTVRQRNQTMRRKVGGDSEMDVDKMPELDIESLPEITVEPTDEQRTIAGYAAFKHVVRVNEELFQEIWVASDLDLTDELDPKKVVKYQQKSSRGMIGKSSKPYNALYRSEAYAELLKKGYALRTFTHHIAGGYDQKAKSIREADIDDARFEIPKGYRKVAMKDVFTVDHEDED